MGGKTSKDGRREHYFGYMLDALVRIAPPGGQRIPLVAERVVVSPASKDVVAPSLTMLDSTLMDGATLTDIVVDRHYSYKKVERWADELRERGISQHLDLHQNDRGFRDYNGTRITGGWPHCPGTPDELGDIAPPGLNATREEKDEFQRLIAKRQAYALDRNTRTRPNGRSQWICPAVAGKVACPLRPETEAPGRAMGLPLITNAPEPDTAPKCCTNKGGTVTIDYAPVRKLEQPFYWGSPEWRAAYDRRSFVEGMFGSLKDTDGTGVRRGFTKFMNLPQNALSLAFAVAVCNLRHQRKFWSDPENLSGRPDHPLLTEDAPNYGWIPAPHPQETDDVTSAA